MTGKQVVPNKGDMTISQLCDRFVESYVQAVGSTPKVIEAGIRADHYFILAEIAGRHVYAYGDESDETCAIIFDAIPAHIKPWFQNALQSIAITADTLTEQAVASYAWRNAVAVPTHTKFGSLGNGERFKYGGTEYTKTDDGHAAIGTGTVPHVGFGYLENVERI